ncbi:autotransporter assembly complex family protein [Phenylobacterium sp.]|uniref:autotransporter assembly complex protein TamA n=1 Tax=Phenylobacterium sp. TaxID=1871053 RepID=UPI0027344830|nr:autotransporter assembly complex family protein [Phenylobacterium sp.]MDP3854643.1 autotransporter assembly complex family protein [Phenylobacterium sp.]
MARLVVAFAASAALCAFGAARAETPRAAIEGELTGDLRDVIARAIGETDKPIGNRFEARRRAREAGDNAIAVLRSEGYYAYEVEPDVGEGDPPAALVRVTPGTRFAIAEPTIAWGDAPPLAEVQAAGEAVMGLATGQPGRAADVIGAEGRIVAATQKRGYADVAPAPREVIVDHADKTVRPTFHIVAGPLVRLNGLEVMGGERTRRAWLNRMAPWRAGEVYDPEDVGELERRLLDTGVYDSVTVALAPPDKTTPEGLRPVVVSLADRAPRTIELGASYSTSEGIGVDARWTRYNMLGRADTLSFFARASDIDSRLGAEATLPHWRRAQQTLKAAAAAYDVKTDAYDETGLGVRADVQRRFGKTSYVTVGASLDYSETDEKQTKLLTPLGRELLTVAGLAAASLDRSDDPLDPKRGWRLEVRAEPTYIAGDESLPYLKVQTQGSLYMPFGDRARTVLAGRVKVGAMVGGSVPEVPAPRRFFAGGGGSVRGYAYQAIGPRLADNTPQGGASVLEASFEVRQKIGHRWGVVAFVDGGAVGTDQIPTGKDFSAGVGIGVRYDLGFGPIRADIAIPLDKRKGDSAFQVYLSIGQSF